MTNQQTTTSRIKNVEEVKTPPVPNFTNSAEHIAATLGSPIDERHRRVLQKGNTELSYYSWACLCKCMHHRAPGWSFELREVKVLADQVVVVGRLTIPCADGQLTYDAVSSEALDSGGFAPIFESVASSCFRRACALANLGLNLWLENV